MGLVEKLRSYFTYKRSTGELRWAVQKSARAPVGALAGTPHSKGYLRVMVDGKNMYVHRIAWAIVHGEFPLQIDHKNTNRADNRLRNLRPATNSQNNHNKKTRKATNTGEPNVYFDVRYGSYRACIYADGKRIHLGSFKSLAKAKRAVRHGRAQHQPYFNQPKGK